MCEESKKNERSENSLPLDLKHEFSSLSNKIRESCVTHSVAGSIFTFSPCTFTTEFSNRRLCGESVEIFCKYLRLYSVARNSFVIKDNLSNLFSGSFLSYLDDLLESKALWLLSKFHRTTYLSLAKDVCLALTSVLLQLQLWLKIYLNKQNLFGKFENEKWLDLLIKSDSIILSPIDSGDYL
eukprot:GHVP01060391.1.p1 GENE.GHVP01060391.1~~GHVP01060391.1.p1  ORF type:complete len:182 (-),score=21.16 GHVP01060391.1:930-1475(-)